MGILDIFKNSTKDIPVVCNVDLDRYLGRWYEIARLPHSFEKGIDNATATYKLREDGKIDVTNAGIKNGKESEANAIAWIADKDCSGRLFVSFFRPFKGEYNIIKLAEDYSYAVVTSDTKNYFWILSRTPEISDQLYNELISFAEGKGFDISKVIKVNQDKNIK